MIIGQLMIEHRLIERMVKVVDKALENAGREGSLNPLDIEAFVDFMRFYADKCHHGKEEGLLFKELAKKDISREHKKIMGDLISDHFYGRSLVDRLVSLNSEYKAGEKGKLTELISVFSKLAVFYSAHIQKEDKTFFIPTMNYFEHKEHSAMLEACKVFDLTSDFSKYQKMVLSLEAALKTR